MPLQISTSTTPPSGAAEKSENSVEVKTICCYFDNPAVSAFQMCRFAVFICLISFFFNSIIWFWTKNLFIKVLSQLF